MDLHATPLDTEREDDAPLTALELEGWQEPGFPWLKVYTAVCVAVAAVLGHSYFLLNRSHGKAGGLLGFFVRHHLLLGKGQTMAPDAGGPISFRFGWIGIFFILLTNAYVLRRKFPLALKGWGSLSVWLDMHIFFGMIGPIFIVFHTNFKVGGLVAISFWSMIVSFASGVVGRYFYIQVLGRREDLRRELDDYRAKFADWHKRGVVPADDTLERMIEKALTVVGVDKRIALDRAGMMTVLWMSLAGDFRKRTWRAGRMKGVPRTMAPVLLGYAVAARRYLTARYYRRLIGYWHAFHKPFAIFMYIVVVFHITAALIFRTKS